MSFYQDALASQRSAEAKLNEYKLEGDRLAHQVMDGIRDSLGWEASNVEILNPPEGKHISKVSSLTDDGRIAFAFRLALGGMQRPFHFSVQRERGPGGWTLKHAEASWPFDPQRMPESLRPAVEHVKALIHAAIAEFYFTDRT